MQYIRSLEDLATAQSEGNLTQEKAMEIMGKYKPMIEAYNVAIAAGKTPTEALALATGQIGAAAETTAGQYDPLQTNILKTATAYDTLVNGIAKTTVTFPVPDISPFTTAILTIATGWDTVVAGIQGAKVTVPAPIIVAATNAFKSVEVNWKGYANKIQTSKYNIAAPNIKPATDAFKSVEVNWKGYANKIQSIIPKITVNNSQALSAISKVVSAMNNVKSKSVTLSVTTVKTTINRTVQAHALPTRAGHAIMPAAGAGAGSETMAIPPMINNNNTVLAAPTTGGGGDLNITIINRDEFGTEKIRKYKAALGGSRFTFGTVGAGKKMY